MQIVQGIAAAEEEEYKSTAERDIKSTRGLIFDRNGNLLAYNELKYAVVMSDTGVLTTIRHIFFNSSSSFCCYIRS